MRYPGEFPQFKTQLEPGDKGIEVKKLQKFLNWALDGSLEITGNYGSRTTEAVKLFQDKAGIVMDGIFGKKSLSCAKAYDKPDKGQYQGELPSGNYTFKQPVYIVQAVHKRNKWKRAWLFSIKKANAYHWTQVMRCKDIEKREKIARGMELAVGNQRITYSNKNTLYPLAKEVGFDCSKVTKKCTTHCANLLSVALHYARIKTPSSMHAGKVDDELRKLGGFKFYKSSKYTHKTEFLKRGDILQAGDCPHVAVVKNDGQYTKETLCYGDKHLAVGKWQTFLNWYFNDSVCDINNTFNNDTQKYTIEFQTKEMGEDAADGIVGVCTLDAARKIEK